MSLKIDQRIHTIHIHVQVRRTKIALTLGQITLSGPSHQKALALRSQTTTKTRKTGSDKLHISTLTGM